MHPCDRKQRTKNNLLQIQHQCIMYVLLSGSVKTELFTPKYQLQGTGQSIYMQLMYYNPMLPLLWTSPLQ